MSNIECPVTYAPPCTLRGPIPVWLRFTIQKNQKLSIVKKFSLILQVRINKHVEGHSCCVLLLLLFFTKVKLAQTFEFWVFCHLCLLEGAPCHCLMCGFAIDLKYCDLQNDIMNMPISIQFTLTCDSGRSSASCRNIQPLFLLLRENLKK